MVPAYSHGDRNQSQSQSLLSRPLHRHLQSLRSQLRKIHEASPLSGKRKRARKARRSLSLSSAFQSHQSQNPSQLSKRRRNMTDGTGLVYQQRMPAWTARLRPRQMRSENAASQQHQCPSQETMCLKRSRRPVAVALGQSPVCRLRKITVMTQEVVTRDTLRCLLQVGYLPQVARIRLYESYGVVLLTLFLWTGQCRSLPRW